MFRDKFYANNGGADRRESRKGRARGRAQAFDFHSREESCMTGMKSAGDQTVKETLERPRRHERLSFNVRDEQEIFPSTGQRIRRKPDSNMRQVTRDFDRDNRTLLCVMRAVFVEVVTNRREGWDSRGNCCATRITDRLPQL